MPEMFEFEEGMKHAKRGEIAFSFVQGKTPEESKLVFSKTKKAKDINKKLKRDVGGSKFAYGTAVVEQSTLKLKVEEDKVPSLERVLKEFLSANKSNVKKVDVGENSDSATN